MDHTNTATRESYFYRRSCGGCGIWRLTSVARYGPVRFSATLRTREEVRFWDPAGFKDQSALDPPAITVSCLPTGVDVDTEDYPSSWYSTMRFVAARVGIYPLRS